MKYALRDNNFSGLNRSKIFVSLHLLIWLWTRMDISRVLRFYKYAINTCLKRECMFR